MQTATREAPRGFFNTGMTTFRREGVRGLYRGTTPALAFGLIENTVAFAVNEQLKRILIQQQLQGSRSCACGELPLWKLACCGAAGGFLHCCFSCPTEVVKCRMQVVGSQFLGPLDCAKQTLCAEGVAGLYKGFLPFVLREVPFYLTFFVSYEVICSSFQRGTAVSPVSRERVDLSPFEIITAGGIAGMIGWSGVQPLDTAMVRIQTGQGAGGSSGSFSRTCSEIYRIGGWRGFFPGWVPAMLRAFPANAALFLGFEGSRRGCSFVFQS